MARVKAQWLPWLPTELRTLGCSCWDTRLPFPPATGASRHTASQGIVRDVRLTEQKGSFADDFLADSGYPSYPY